MSAGKSACGLAGEAVNMGKVCSGLGEDSLSVSSVSSCIPHHQLGLDSLKSDTLRDEVTVSNSVLPVTVSAPVQVRDDASQCLHIVPTCTKE